MPLCVYYKLLLRSINAIAKAGSCLLFLHMLAGSLKQTGVTPPSCPANINGAIGGVCMGRYSCHQVNSPCVPLHLQPSSVVLVYVAVALGWCGEVKWNQRPAVVFQADGLSGGVIAVKCSTHAVCLQGPLFIRLNSWLTILSTSLQIIEAFSSPYWYLTKIGTFFASVPFKWLLNSFS